MAHGPLRDTAQKLSRAALATADPSVPDGELVARFVTDRSEPAFAELVRRHGPAVLTICRRILGHVQDAEDAFQAVFLVLARRAGAVRPPGAVRGWLYGVAVRTAHKARVMTAKRHRRLAVAAARARPDTHDPPPGAADVRTAIDEELAALSDEHRAALVLCDLHGMSRAEAARDLGWPEGTVATRLAKARQVIAARLRRRGVMLSVAGLSGLLAADAPAAVTSELAATAIATALGPISAVPPVVHTLALGVMKTMSHATAKVLALVATLTGLFGIGVVAATGGPSAPPPAGTAKATPGLARAAGAPRPEAAEWQEAKSIQVKGWLAGSLAYSPDGKRLAVGGTGANFVVYDAASLANLWGARNDGDFVAVAYSPDGKTFAATTTHGVILMDATAETPVLTAQTVEEKGSKPTSVAFFPDTTVESGDQKLTNRKLIFGNARGYHVVSWLKWPPSGGIELNTVAAGKEPADPFTVPLAVDPAGRSVVCAGPIHRDTGKNVLWAWVAGDYGPGSPGNRILEGHKARVVSAAWSADGKTVVTGDADGVLILWDAGTMKEKARVQFSGTEVKVVAVAVTADGSRVAAGVAGPQEFMDHSVPQQVVYEWLPAIPGAKPVRLGRRIGEGLYRGYASVAYSPDGQQLAAAFASLDFVREGDNLGNLVYIWRRAAAK